SSWDHSRSRNLATGLSSKSRMLCCTAGGVALAKLANSLKLAVVQSTWSCNSRISDDSLRLFLTASSRSELIEKTRMLMRTDLSPGRCGTVLEGERAYVR